MSQDMEAMKTSLDSRKRRHAKNSERGERNAEEEKEGLLKKIGATTPK